MCIGMAHSPTWKSSSPHARTVARTHHTASASPQSLSFPGSIELPAAESLLQSALRFGDEIDDG